MKDQWFMNLDSGEPCFAMDDRLAISADGTLLLRVNDNLVINPETGKPEIVTGWSAGNCDFRKK